MPAKYMGPTWADAAMTVREYERDARCRIVVEFNPSTVRPGGWAVAMRGMRLGGRTDWYTIHHIERLFPSNGARTLPALLMNMAREVCDGVVAYDERPVIQQALMPEAVLPLPLLPEAST